MAKDFIDVIIERGKKPRAGGDAPPKGAADDGDGGKDPAPEETGDDDYGKVEGDAVGELAGMLEVPDDKREAFGRALSEAIEACVKRLAKDRSAKE